MKITTALELEQYNKLAAQLDSTVREIAYVYMRERLKIQGFILSHFDNFTTSESQLLTINALNHGGFLDTFQLPIGILWANAAERTTIIRENLVQEMETLAWYPNKNKKEVGLER